jgi:two-component system response regulator QseB
VRGLDRGADDYLVKPVALAELDARVRAVTRRAAGLARGVLEVGPLSIDPSARQVAYRGVPVDLQPREYALLHALALRAGQVLTRSQLESQLYEWDDALESNAIEVHVHRLRRKLSPDLIRTVRGVGYMLAREIR